MQMRDLPEDGRAEPVSAIPSRLLAAVFPSVPSAAAARMRLITVMVNAGLLHCSGLPGQRGETFWIGFPDRHRSRQDFHPVGIFIRKIFDFSNISFDFLIF